MYSYKTGLSQFSKFLSAGLGGDAFNATANGSSVDLKAEDLFEARMYGEGALAVWLEGVNGAPSSFAVKVRLEHSDDDTTFVPYTESHNVSAAALTFTAAGVQVLAFRPQGLKRYVRAAAHDVSFSGGTSPSVKLRSLFWLTEPNDA